MRKQLFGGSLRRALSLFVTLAMVLGMCPAVGLAQDAENDEASLVAQGEPMLSVQELPSVSYLDEKGEQQECTSYFRMTSDTYKNLVYRNRVVVGSVRGADYTWVVIEGEVTLDNLFSVQGDAHVILKDGAKLIAKGGIEVFFDEIGQARGSLTIYAQSTGTSMGEVSVPQAGEAGILASGSNVTINGGKLDVVGTDAGISTSSAFDDDANVTVNGGEVTATGTGGQSWGIRSWKSVTINGGTVTASGKSGGINSFDSVTISDGTVTAESPVKETDADYDRNAAYCGIDSKNVTINGGTVTAFSLQSSIYVPKPDGNLTIGPGITVKAGDDETSATDHTADFATSYYMYPWAQTTKAAPVPEESEPHENDTGDPATYTVTYKVVNGTWSDGGAGDKTEAVADGSKPANVPTGMRPAEGYTGGAWDKDPASATITSDAVFTYAFEKKAEEKKPEEGKTEEQKPSENKPEPASIRLTGSGHVQGAGDEAAASDGGAILIGTTGESRRLEAITVNLPEGTDGTIAYRAHVQGTGWTGWATGGEQCGTTGESRRIESVQFALSGAVADGNSVWYRVHSQTFGWLGWAKDGQAAGTAGQSKRAEAVEVQVLPKGQVPEGYAEGQASYVGAVTGDAHVQGTGWTGGASALSFGTTGESRRLEAISLAVGNQPAEGGISYEVHARGIGWMPAAADGALAGTTGESRRLEALRVSLTGDLAAEGAYSVWYRVHSQTYGWLGWAHDGADAGTTGLSRRAEAVEVQVLPQGQFPSDYDAAQAACLTV